MSGLSFDLLVLLTLPYSPVFRTIGTCASENCGQHFSEAEFPQRSDI